jgi:hypothetical protein
LKPWRTFEYVKRSLPAQNVHGPPVGPRTFYTRVLQSCSRVAAFNFVKPTKNSQIQPKRVAGSDGILIAQLYGETAQE